MFLSGQLYRGVVPDGSCFTLEERRPLHHRPAGAVSDGMPEHLALGGAADVDTAMAGWGSWAKAHGQGQASGARACYITLAKMNRELIAR